MKGSFAKTEIDRDGLAITEAQIAPYVSTAVIGHWLNKTVDNALDHANKQEGSQFHSPPHHRLVKRELSDECHRSDLMVD